MSKEKFNPIAQLPTLPGAEVVSDEAETNIIDSTYPTTDVPNKEIKKQPQIEIRLKSEEPAEIIVQKNKEEHLAVVRIIILIVLILLVLLGIFLTLNFVPKIARNASNFSQSLSSFFVSKKTSTPALTSTSTSAPIPATIPLVATSTPQTITYVPPTLTSTTTYQTTIVNQPAPTQPTIATQPKTPAKLAVNIISTSIVGGRTIVKFNIQNVGGTTSGTWSFSATLPSSVTPKYYSAVQSPLTPKSGVIYTLGFTADQDYPVQIAIFQ